MSAKQAPHHAASSPPSAGSPTGYETPSTVPTVMSPESGNASKTGNAAVSTLQLDAASNGPSPGASSIFARRNGHHDLPAVTISIPLTRVFSPTAEEFTPIAQAMGMFNLNNAQAGGSRADDQYAANNHGDVGQVAAPGTLLLPPRFPAHIYFGNFTSDESTARAFVVTGCSLYYTDFQFIAMSYKNFNSLSGIDASLLHEGTFAVEFTDFSEAKQAAMLTLRFLFKDQPVKVFKLTPKDLALKRGQREEFVSNWEGTYSVGIVADEEDAPVSAVALSPGFLLQTLKTAGVVKAFAKVDHKMYEAANPKLLALYRAEWADTAANIGSLSGASYMGNRIVIQEYTPDVVTPVAQPVMPSRSIPRVKMPAQPAMPTLQALKDEEHAERVQSFLRQPRSTHVNSNHNVVDILRIMRGLDVRTTIMLRNIPNRVNQEGLKTVLDQTSKFLYDFMYLRIDFANNCNVGYAFINFITPEAIIAFAEARAGKKWNLFNSDKVAEISYATIQGRDCLIQKFRNSSVMLERGSFRPKLYKTTGPDAGSEEPFPGPDNQAKLKRSCDNAEHVGLYIPPTRVHTDLPAPRNQTAGGSYVAPASGRRALYMVKPNIAPAPAPAERDIFTYPGTSPTTPTSLYAPREGQAYREHQRRQQTQFDRGTPGAEVQSRRSFSSVQSSGYLTTATSLDWNKSASPVSPFYVHSPEMNAGNRHENVRKLGHTLGHTLGHMPSAHRATAHPTVPEAPNHFVRRLLGCL